MYIAAFPSTFVTQSYLSIQLYIYFLCSVKTNKIKQPIAFDETFITYAFCMWNVSLFLVYYCGVKYELLKKDVLNFNERLEIICYIIRY